VAVNAWQYRRCRDPHISGSSVDHCAVIRCDGRILQIAFQSSLHNCCEFGPCFPCAHGMGILFHLGICLVPVASFHRIGREGCAILLRCGWARLLPQFSCPFSFISRVTAISSLSLRISARSASVSSRSVPTGLVKVKWHQQSQHSAQPSCVLLRWPARWTNIRYTRPRASWFGGSLEFGDPGPKVSFGARRRS
jgi:hypothetical protein